MTDDGGPEELPQQPQRARTLRWNLALAAAVLIVIALLTKHGRDVGTADSTVGPTPTSPTSPSDVPHGLDDEGLAVFPVPDRHAGTVARCPAGFDCPVSHRISAGTRAALYSAFPGVHVVRARTVRTVVVGYGQAIWTQDVRARVGDQLIRLRLQPASPTDHASHSSTLFGGHAITHWESILSQLVVLIDVVAPADSPAPLAAIEQLAHDGRLTSPW